MLEAVLDAVDVIYKNKKLKDSQLGTITLYKLENKD